MRRRTRAAPTAARQLHAARCSKPARPSVAPHLEPAQVFWAIGLLAAGQVSTIALTYAGQLVMTGLLQLEVKGWARMLGTRLVALVPALTGG